MTELWDSHGVLKLTRQRTLHGHDLAAHLQQEPVHFVVANIGQRLNCVPPPQCYDFWKSEVKPRLVETEHFYLEDYPGEYCYVASEWSGGALAPVVLLETYH